ncbi:MAG: hypothetical protein KAQ67_07215, partial [Gammaproteobacteria bacterium]|nr:hypothetical protein [Gammaproteobacteria bacterium]
MKKSYWRLLVATVLVAVALLIKTTSDGQFKYTYTYFFSDYTHSFNELSKKYKIDFIYSVDESFIDPSLIGVSLINKAENISDFELSRYSVLLADIFSEYPENVIKDEISTIKLASTLTLFGVSYGGTSINSTLYLTSSGLENGYSDIYIKELFHHEFSSILMRKHHFPREKWAKFNSINFKYAQNASDILEAISKDKGTEGNNLLYKNGFLT